MKKVLAAVTAVNLWSDYTKKSLESIFSQEKNDFELTILLMDNGSVDETKSEEETLEMARGDFHFIRFDTNQGLQKAWNKILDFGFVAGSGFDYVFIGNNDTLFHPHCISRMVEQFNASAADVVMVTAINVRGECPTPEAIFTLDEAAKKDLVPNEHPDFSAFMVNKRFVDEVGYADEGFYPAFFEDNDLHRRIKMAGLYAYNCPQALYYHFCSGTQYNTKYKEGRVDSTQFGRNQNYYTQKWGGGPGHERYPLPFNCSNTTVKTTKQP